MSVLEKIIKALNIVQQIKEEINNGGVEFGKWVDLAFEVLPLVAKILETINNPTPVVSLASSKDILELQKQVEAAGFDFAKWIAILINVAPLIQQLIDLFTTKENV